MTSEALALNPHGHPGVAFRLRVALAILLVPASLAVAQDEKKSFALPAGAAEKTLRLFSAQSGLPVLFPTDVTKGVRTQAVRGKFPPRQALDRMLAGTVLVAVQDEKNGSLTIRRQPGPNAAEAAQKVSGERARSSGSSDFKHSPTNNHEDNPRIMKRLRNPIPLLGLWLGLVAMPVQAQTADLAPATGTVTGSVFNAATKAYLANAEVTVQGTGISTVTDEHGRFRIERVPAGAQIVHVSYMGLDPMLREVVVVAGMNPLDPIALTSEIYQMQAFTVTGTREGNAAAFARQRHAANIMTVLATDSMGEISDGNIGDFLKRVPGISGGGVSEVTTIGVRGLAATHTAVTLDGIRMPSPSGHKDQRTFEVDKFPADYIESIEVIKAPTPEMDADAVGGTVNLRSKSAFNLRGRSVKYRFGVNHVTFGDSYAPHGSAQYSDMFGPNLGVVFTVNYSTQYLDRDTSQLQLENVPDANGNLPIWRTRLFIDHRYRTRTGTGVKVDYRLGESSALTFGFVYNYYSSLRRPNEWTFESAGNPGQTPAARRTPDSNALRTVFLQGIERIQSNNTQARQEVFSWQAGGEHRLKSGYVIDYRGTWAPAKGWEDRWWFNIVPRFEEHIIIERQNPLDPFPIFTKLTPGLDDWDRARFRPQDRQVVKREGEKHEAIWSGDLNVSKELNIGIPVTLKNGMRYRGQSFRTRFLEDGRRSRNYIDPENNWNRFKRPGLTRTLFGLDQYKDAIVFADPREIYLYTQQHPEGWSALWSPREVQENMFDNGKAREEILAGYTQATVRFGRLLVLGGVRVERTDITATGWLHDPKRNPLPAPTAATATVDDWVAFYTGEFHRQKTTRDYSNVFPSLHLRYAITPGWLARLSYSEGINRPRFSEVIPTSSVSRSADDEEFGRLTMRNTGLLPETSRNYDVSLEYYFEPVGLISVSSFRKELKNFIYVWDTVVTPELMTRFKIDPEYAGWDFRTRENRGAGTVRGFEVAYNQHLGKIAPWLKGFSAYASYAKTSAKGDLQRIIPAVWKAGFGYDMNRWAARLHFNANSRRQISFSNNPLENQYREAEPDLEMNLEYRFSRKFALYMDGANLLDRKVIERQGIPSDPANYHHFQYGAIGRRISFGVRGTF
jgi:iron complex outermembrane recepter protein